MIWGDPIEVNGVRPAWLADDERIWMRWGDTDHWSDLNDERWPVEKWDEQDWKQINQFRLSATHPAYLAIAKGFEPWAGGDSAPDDWDQGAVLLRSGDICLAKHITYWGDDGQSNDIIGYKRKQAKDDGDYVSVKRMTEEDIIDGRFAKYSTYEPLTAITEALRDIGIIREPTQAETIATKTGLTVDQVQSVLNEVSHGTR